MAGVTISQGTPAIIVLSSIRIASRQLRDGKIPWSAIEKLITR